MSRVARCYDIPALLAQGGNDMGRVKGDQRGSLVRIGRKYYGRFSKWVTAGNQTQWKAVKEPLCATSEGKARAIELLNERVAAANGPAAVLLGNATVKQFVELRFKAEHIDRKKASGREIVAKIDNVVDLGNRLNDSSAIALAMSLTLTSIHAKAIRLLSPPPDTGGAA